jgi:hypothetical protein
MDWWTYVSMVGGFLTLIQPGSGKSVIYWGPGSLLSRGVNWPLLVLGRCVIERGGFQCLPGTLRQHYWEKARDLPDWEPASPRTLRGPETGTDWNADWRRTALRTMARQDLFPYSVVCISSKTSRKQGDRQSPAVTGLLMKNVTMVIKVSFFYVTSEVETNLEDVFAEIDQFYLIRYIRILSGIWRQSCRGQLWPRPVELGLTDVCQTLMG